SKLISPCWKGGGGGKGSRRNAGSSNVECSDFDSTGRSAECAATKVRYERNKKKNNGKDLCFTAHMYFREEYKRSYLRFQGTSSHHPVPGRSRWL
ncbi:unnamed protein product, partial [Heterotrigona itama]